MKSLSKDNKIASETRKKALEKRKPYQKKRVIVPIFTAIVFVFLGIYGLIYSSFYQSTDDAFVEAHMVYFAPRVSGQIVELNVDDNTEIKKGEIIAKIDDKDFIATLNQAQAKLEKAKSDLNVSDDDIEKMSAMTSQKKNDIESAKSKLDYANSDYIRYKNAYQDGSVTKQDLDNAIKNLDVARAQFKAAQDGLSAAKSGLNSTVSKKISQNAEIKKLLAEVEQAKLNLSYTTLYSPIDGVITNKNIETGNYVKAGNSIMSIVPHDVYIIANFKETQIANMKQGQKVTIKIDTFGSKKFKGHVDSIQKASGAKASLFPPENAVGSYVKVVQRIPVKIVFDEDITNYNIIPGMSVVPKVKVK